MIKKEKNGYSLYTKDGKKKLGSFSSYKEALKRLRQIEFWKGKAK